VLHSKKVRKTDMKKHVKNIAIAAASVAILIGSGCRKQLDVNNNPNIATAITPDLLLPSAEVNLAVAMGVDVHTTSCMWAEYWTQSPTASQYRDVEQYQPSGGDFDREWGQFYSATLADLHKMEQAAVAVQRPQYIAISKLLQAYTFQVITDAWGDVPFRDALRGETDQGVILAPKYDKQALIYDSLIAMVDEGLAIINPADAKRPTTDDVIFGGNMTSWRKFGNTLKLKIFMRLSEVNPTKAQAGITALVGSGAQFLTATDNAQVAFFATAGNRNPLAGEFTALNYTQNQVASSTAIDSLNRNNDPRIGFFYDVAYDGICNEYGYLGIRQGDYNLSASTLVSAPGPTTGANGNFSCNANYAAARRAPVRLLMGYESLFLQAEAVARYGAGTLTADSLFHAAIRANFTHLGATAASATSYIGSSYWAKYPTGGTVDQQVRHIITQKWFSMCGIQGFESWTEFRRTGYPNFLVPSVNGFLGGQLPSRFPYPNTELTRNTNFPGQPVLTAKVYWDVK
jgi:hypothetical protein